MLGRKTVCFHDTYNVSISWGMSERILQKSVYSFFPQESSSKVFPATMDNQKLGKLSSFWGWSFNTNGFANCAYKHNFCSQIPLPLAETSSLGHSLPFSLLLAFLLLHVFGISIWPVKTFEFIKYAWKN